MKIELEIDEDEFDKMLCKTLKTLYEFICNTYQFDVLGGENAHFPIFSTNKVKEKEQLEKFIDSIAMVHNYYCLYDERIGFEDTHYT